MIFLFQTVFSATEAAKLFTFHRASVLQEVLVVRYRTQHGRAVLSKQHRRFSTRNDGITANYLAS
ncbi:hypothetical protein CQ12_16980 [Bradyrhizobium jicamae]|uniref:Uncharacterized protein n=1 Tax=Bradyrhizobium jicamae TaxID=280332 RepID=A0A0R3KVH8_9BRAD|nr:hypothetical protein [Bradyrhizobium jicamae]KRQ99656.1 hypothetical protein CQ12_16980 [Bradyrhizobium jicamae]